MTGFKKFKKIYFIGIKGVAVSGLALILKQLGFEVSGSDVPDKFLTDKVLLENKIRIFKKFDAENLKIFKPDAVVFGASWVKNSELAYAVRNKIPSFSESDVRGWISRQKKTIAVTGVHGKTTTTAWLSYIFSRDKKDPAYLFGSSKAYGLKGNGHWGSGRHFIVEGDEYAKSISNSRPKFLDLRPKITVITSLEWEHVDIYKNLVQMQKVFTDLIDKTISNKGKIFVCSDWPAINKIISGKKNIITYGFNSKALWQPYDVRFFPGYTLFKIKKREKFFGEFKIRLLGSHNVLNACVCAAVASGEGVSKEKIRQALFNFKGTKRRFNISRIKNVTYIDDYGHHPTEISTTLEAVRQKFPKKYVRCVFQPHTYSRTRALLENFSGCFGKCDQIVFTDIFASAREKKKSCSSEILCKKTGTSHPDARYTGSLKSTKKFLDKNVKKNDVVVVMGAGDVYKLIDN
ncbi:UDP-N-acetylmuramate--L-alanine ligase [Candidatus Parcubacteria bacterium]|nr:MAG: UDP-N-acetylmuramate--L-alanine ligase [Candidatus Parcubacteria bacterium]